MLISVVVKNRYHDGTLKRKVGSGTEPRSLRSIRNKNLFEKYKPDIELKQQFNWHAALLSLKDKKTRVENSFDVILKARVAYRYRNSYFGSVLFPPSCFANSRRFFVFLIQRPK